MNFDALIHAHYEDLSQLDLDILRTARMDRRKTAEESITVFAARCNVSPATVVHLAKKMGLSGFSEMKYLLKSSEESSGPDPATSGNTSADIEKTIRAFNDNLAVDDIISQMMMTTSIYAFGSGHGQRLMLEDFGRSLSAYGLSVTVFSGFAEARQIAGRLTADNIMFFASQDGDASMLRPALQTLDLNRVNSVSLTPFGDNELAQLTTYRLHYFNSRLDPKSELNSSTFLLLHLVLHLLQERYSDRSGASTPFQG